MPLRISLVDVQKLGKAAVAQIKPAIAFSLETWRDIPRVTVRLGPEDTAHLEIMNWLRTTLPADWIAFHIPAEAKRSQVVWALLRILGFFAGFPDIILIRPGGQCYFIEVKRPDQKPSLSPTQEAFRRWAERTGTPWLVAQTANDAEMWLRRLGAI